MQPPRVAALALVVSLAACSAPASVAPTVAPREWTITPEQPRIGQPFTVKLQRIATSPSKAALPDGAFKVELAMPHDDPVNFPFPFNWPRPAPTRPIAPVEIGVIAVANGVGETTFELRADYGNGFKPEAGKPLGINFSGPQRGMGAAFLVGRP